ncbi:MAG TPA: hypothetical protein VIM44_08010 [Rariglobus sp.]
MNPPRAYAVIAPLSLYDTLRGLSRPRRRLIEDFLHRLARHPALRGDFEAPGEDNRVHQVKMIGDWLISYWIDHPAREIRVTSLEPIE